ncbi:ABC transporter ATP-binding protein [Novisyntrophococcus fermenticellae]|uniref:ABC transporter ATP-binding protein n=1 Tax=Novisyntrophococcus fermenticellae TaxID=2068655 RepID=UPI001E63F136|nr:ABC transporter ATP-binding protein [Novisyntrophococcus fermenticellae]
MCETVKKEVEIEIRDLGVTFEDNSNKNVQALTGVNMNIYKGEFVSLLGPSGCGKTTLLRAVADLQEPTEGTVRIAGMTPREIRLQQKFGFVFQQPVLFNWRTVKKNIELPLEIMYYSKEDRSARAEEMLEMVGLTKFSRHFPRQLSGGMQQRVNIARAFGIRPEILLMDEPFSALDEFTKEKLHEDLLQIWQQTNKTILFVTHNIQEAVFLSDRVCILSPHPGRLSAVVDIDLPRPRTLEIKETQHFNELVTKARNSFERGSIV